MAQPNRGAVWVFNDLLSFQPQSYETPLLGYVFLTAGFLLTVSAVIIVSRPIRWFLNYLDVAEAPVSILETKIELTMLDSHHIISEVTRKQKIHANRSDVNAYHHSMATSNGTIEKNSWRFESKIDGRVVTLDPLTRVTPTTLEVIERFIEPLPTSYSVTYLPNNLVLMLNDIKRFKIFNDVLVSRETSLKNKHEYDGFQPILQLKCVKYPATNVEMSINFPRNTAPDIDQIECFLITENVAKSIPIKNEDIVQGDRRLYIAQIPSLKRDQMLRFQWKNDKLHQEIASGLPLTS